MQRFILFPLFFVSFLIGAQTNVIALKSHAGDFSQLKAEQDNFGLPAATIDTFYYLGNNCVLQVSHYFHRDDRYNRDTICDPYNFKLHNFDLDKIRPMYSEHVVFVGFEKYESDSEKHGKTKRSKGALPLLFVLLILGGYYFRKQKSIRVD